MNELLHAKQVAKRLNVGYRTALRLINTVLPNVQLPGRRGKLVDPADVDALILARKRAPSNETEPEQVEQNAALLTPCQNDPKPYKANWYERFASK